VCQKSVVLYSVVAPNCGVGGGGVFVIGYGPKEGSVVPCKSDCNPAFLCIRFSSLCERQDRMENRFFYIYFTLLN
jgi:hypothetical protein